MFTGEVLYPYGAFRLVCGAAGSRNSSLRMSAAPLGVPESVLQHRQFLGGESGRGVDDHDVVAIGQRTHVEHGAQSLVDVRQAKTALQVVDLHTAEPIG